MINDKLRVITKLCKLIELVANDVFIKETVYDEENDMISYKIVIDKSKSNSETEE